jgi:peptidoglycan-associated lipoprotein
MKTMKLANLFNLLALGAALSIVGAGCRHAPVGTTPLSSIKHPNINNNNPGPELLPPAPRFNPGDNGNSGGFNNRTPNIPVGPVELTGDFTGWTEDSDTLRSQTIHFDYDKSAVKSSEESKLDAVYAYLTGHADKALRIQGNCDERGTEEYNRSLGERRALAGREYLVRKGIDPKRIDVVTFGKDKPVDNGHSEASWSQNRRDDFVVLTAPGR